MESFTGKLAVVTGGGTGMGREITRALAADGCDVAIGDVSDETMAETQALCAQESPGAKVTTHVADVSDADQMVDFAAAVAADHATDHINLLFNNAGIGGGGSFLTDDRESWDKVFGVCWGGVYNGSRAFMPLLVASDEGHIVNTSSVNGFWAALGLGTPHTAYSAAKFAVKGFTEALIIDLRLNAPHVHASVVMPGHIGTEIVHNSFREHGRNPKELTTEQLVEMRADLAGRGLDLSSVSDEDLRAGMVAQADLFRDTAPTSAAQAAAMILDGVRAGEWRILVGDDAYVLDEMVRADPTQAYEKPFIEELQARGVFTRMGL
jgi:NAD(P)-dependent dehydrogenase (short-subunit alcohol dehydrogenase family)